MHVYLEHFLSALEVSYLEESIAREGWIGRIQRAQPKQLLRAPEALLVFLGNEVVVC